MGKKTVAIDAFSLLFKAFFALPPMSAPNGTPTNAIHGFLSMLLKLIEQEQPDYFFAAFDSPAQTFRLASYAEYKAGRPEMEEALRAQIPILIEILNEAGVPIVRADGFEADDVLGHIARVGDEAGNETFIVTGDRDSFQLASSLTTIIYSKKGISDTVFVDPAYISSTYGITPKQLIDVKALMGDASDNIPGIKGIGEKTALKLIKAYGSLDGVYENIESEKGKLKERLAEGKDLAYLSCELARIVTQVPVELDYDAASKACFSNSKVIEMLQALSLVSIAKRAAAFKPKEGAPQELKAPKALKESKAAVSFAYETAGGSLCLAAFSSQGESAVAQGSWEDARAFMEDESILKACLNLKTAYKDFSERGIKIKGAVIDVSIASYVLNSHETRYSLGDLAIRHLGELPGELSSGDGSPKGQGQMSFLVSQEAGDALAKAKSDAKTVWELSCELSSELKSRGLEKLYDEIEHPLAITLARMEQFGFKIEPSVLSGQGESLSERAAILNSDILKLAGKGPEFLVSSPKQLGNLLFEELGLPIIKKTKSKAGYSTDSEVLEQLDGMHPIIPKIIELRAINKLNSTYVESMLKLVDPVSEKIHTSFNQTATTTGRLSSSNPNLQNIPMRTDEGRLIRKAFVASHKDWVLIDADYSQIELRVLAHMSGDEAMIEAFHQGVDIHQKTASEVFGVSLADVSYEQRSQAKAVNFGIVYGISAFGLARNLGISQQEAGKYIELYLERFKGVKEYMQKTVEAAKAQGYVETLFSRRVYTPGIYSSNHNTRAFNERVALNAPIQGSAADIIKIAMINIDARLASEGMLSRLILQVHDELIIDCPISESVKAADILREEMCNAAQLSVPLVADTQMSYSWHGAK
ncbi:MAG: DNA polymerase I [Eubacteriaceae bacterium]|nr:DNA polymerase I [Eubacteriaceae bacterium]